MKARFTPEQGAVIRQAVEAVMEEMFEERKNVSAETSRRLACDAGVVHWLEQRDVSTGGIEALSVGRKTRTVPPAIRRALQRRDGGCRFRGGQKPG